MKVILVISLAVLAVTYAQQYTTKYDSIDLDKILNNDRILTNYIKCLMDEGACTNEGRELKKHLPDALETGCTKCNEKQKDATDKVIRFLIKNRTKDWDRLKKKYDPTGEFSKKYQDRLEDITKPVEKKE